MKSAAVVAAALPMLLLSGAAKVDGVAAIGDVRDPDSCLSVLQVTYAPGEGSRSHRHDATVIAYVLKGAVESQVDDEPLRIYHPGDHWVERPGQEHRVSRNASATRPATFLAILLAHKSSKEAQACAS